MNIDKITDVKELKALAYDQITLLDQAQQNLRLINNRIAQVEQENAEKAANEAGAE